MILFLISNNVPLAKSRKRKRDKKIRNEKARKKSGGPLQVLATRLRTERKRKKTGNRKAEIP